MMLSLRWFVCRYLWVAFTFTASTGTRADSAFVVRPLPFSMDRCECVSTSGTGPFLDHTRGVSRPPATRLQGGGCSRSATVRILDNVKMTERKVKLPKPMGIILEEVESSNGAVVAQIDPKGAAAAFSRDNSPFAAANAAATTNDVELCIGDRILAINGADCASLSFEEIMDRIIASHSGQAVELTLGRSKDAIAVQFAENGIAVAAQPGDSFQDLARLARVPILYSCESGGCGTCEQGMISVTRNENAAKEASLSTNNEKKQQQQQQQQRYTRPCVARVPKGLDRILVSPSDRYEPNLE